MGSAFFTVSYHNDEVIPDVTAPDCIYIAAPKALTWVLGPVVSSGTMFTFFFPGSTESYSVSNAAAVCGTSAAFILFNGMDSTIVYKRGQWSDYVFINLSPGNYVYMTAIVQGWLPVLLADTGRAPEEWIIDIDSVPIIGIPDIGENSPVDDSGKEQYAVVIPAPVTMHTTITENFDGADGQDLSSANPSVWAPSSELDPPLFFVSIYTDELSILNNALEYPDQDVTATGSFLGNATKGRVAFGDDSELRISLSWDDYPVSGKTMAPPSIALTADIAGYPQSYYEYYVRLGVIVGRNGTGTYIRLQSYMYTMGGVKGLGDQIENVYTPEIYTSTTEVEIMIQRVNGTTFSTYYRETPGAGAWTGIDSAVVPVFADESMIGIVYRVKNSAYDTGITVRADQLNAAAVGTVSADRTVGLMYDLLSPLVATGRITQYTGNFGYLILPSLSIGGYQFNGTDNFLCTLPLLECTGEARYGYGDMTFTLFEAGAGDVNWGDATFPILVCSSSGKYAIGLADIKLKVGGQSYIQGAPDDIPDTYKPYLLCKDHPDIAAIAEVIFWGL